MHEQSAIRGGSSIESPLESLSLHVSNPREWRTLLYSYHRPLLLHLNADTTWLVQLPYPASHNPPAGRTHFNVLLDPWLQGPQSDVASWFSTQWHVVPPAFSTIAELNEALGEVERRGFGEDQTEAAASYVDAVIISHEFTDHCHRATLEELPPSTPVFATDSAAELIASWDHFDKVVTTPALNNGAHWSRLADDALPSWLAVGRVVTPGNALYYHSAVLLAFNIGDGGRDGTSAGEAIIYSPHGIKSQDLASIGASGVKPLALLHGLHDVRIWLTKQLNLGALNGIKAVGASGSKYWIATHDEIKTGGGIIAPLLRRTRYTLKEAVEYAQAQLKQAGEAPQYVFAELGSGDAMVLE